MRTELELIVLLMAALATGGLMVNWAGLARAVAQLSPSTYVELHQSTNRTFNPICRSLSWVQLSAGLCLPSHLAFTQPRDNSACSAQCAMRP